MTTYLLAGGGTAGHVNPLLAVADALRAREPEARDPRARHARGSRGPPGARARVRAAVRRQGAVPAPARQGGRGLSRRGSVARSRRCARTSASAMSTSSSASAGTRRRPRTSRRVGPAFRSWCTRPTRSPAWRTSLGARRAAGVGVAFEGTPIRGGRVVGMPLRREIVDLDRAALRGEAAEYFGLDAARPTLLVFGGSLGAQRLNEAFGGAWRDVLEAGWQLVHVTGERSDAARPGRSGLHDAPLRRPHGPRVRAVRPDRLARGRSDGQRDQRTRHPGRVRALRGRQRRAGAQRGVGRAGRCGDPDSGCRVHRRPRAVADRAAAGATSTGARR